MPGYLAILYIPQAILGLSTSGWLVTWDEQNSIWLTLCIFMWNPGDALFIFCWGLLTDRNLVVQSRR